MRGEILKGHLDALLLSAVERGPLHGYAIVAELRRKSLGVFDLAEGTVYPALHRLERAGRLESRRTRVDGRERRVYALTRKGRSVLAQSREAWKEFSGAISLVLGART